MGSHITPTVCRHGKETTCRSCASGLNIGGPLPCSSGLKYIFTSVDLLTRWPEADLMEDITTDTVARAFFHTWVSRFSLTLSNTYDRGSHFDSSPWGKIMSMLGIKCIRTASNHPQSNDLKLKASLAATTQGRSDWTTALPLFPLVIRTALKEDVSHSSA